MKLLNILEDSAMEYVESNWFKDYDFHKQGLLFQVNEVFHEQLRKEANEKISSLDTGLEIKYLSTFTYNFSGASCIIKFEAEDIDEGPGNTFLKNILDIVLKA